MPEHKGDDRLYSESTERKFEKRYGEKRGREVWGATVQKVAEEQAADRPSGVKTERVEGHIAYSDEGRRFEVRPTTRRIHAEPHSRGHHSGPCPPDCRKGRREHEHRRGRR